jgi:hypothetical protein
MTCHTHNKELKQSHDLSHTHKELKQSHDLSYTHKELKQSANLNEILVQDQSHQQT